MARFPFSLASTSARPWRQRLLHPWLSSIICALLELLLPWPEAAAPQLLALAAYEGAAVEIGCRPFIVIGIATDLLTGTAPGSRALLYVLFYAAGLPQVRRYLKPVPGSMLTLLLMPIVHELLLTGSLRPTGWQSTFLLTLGAAPLMHRLYRKASHE